MVERTSLNSVVGFFASRELGMRDASIDALRGLAILVMILVNHHPPTADRYGFLVHAPWTGLTVADTVFPVFLFLVGLSITYSSAGRPGDHRRAPWARIIRRTLVLFAINIFLVNFPYYELDKLIVYGTLTRIAYCYFFAVLIYHLCGWRTQLIFVVVILAIQWWFLMRFEVPGVGAGVITVDDNASVYVDRLIFGTFAERLYLNGPIFQGILPGAAAIATTMLGALSGHLVKSASELRTDNNRLLALGIVLVIGGGAWGLAYPISKPLWTGSYVVMMAGLSLFSIGALNYASRFRYFQALVFPLKVAGVNALFIYVFAQLFQRFLVYGRIPQADGSAIRIRHYIHDSWLAPWVDGKPAALLYSVVFLTICYLATYFLYRKRIFVKL